MSWGEAGNGMYYCIAMEAVQVVYICFEYAFVPRQSIRIQIMCRTTNTICLPEIKQSLAGRPDPPMIFLLDVGGMIGRSVRTMFEQCFEFHVVLGSGLGTELATLGQWEMLIQVPPKVSPRSISNSEKSSFGQSGRAPRI